MLYLVRWYPEQVTEKKMLQPTYLPILMERVTNLVFEMFLKSKNLKKIREVYIDKGPKDTRF